MEARMDIEGLRAEVQPVRKVRPLTDDLTALLKGTAGPHQAIPRQAQEAPEAERR